MSPIGKDSVNLEFFLKIKRDRIRVPTNYTLDLTALGQNTIVEKRTTLAQKARALLDIKLN